MDSRENPCANISETYDDDAMIESAVRDVALALADIRLQLGPIAAVIYAGGMVAGLRAFLVENVGLDSTQDLFGRAAADADLCEPVTVLQ